MKKGNKFISKEKVRKMCEFWLRYKDKPHLLYNEHPWYRREIKTFEGLRLMVSGDRKSYTIIVDPFDKTEEEIEESKERYIHYGEIGIAEHYLRKYNEWLFKLAFKDVLEEGSR